MLEPVGRKKLPADKIKSNLITVPVDPQMHEEFAIVCALRGAYMSSLLRQHIVQLIREEKEREPEAFIPKKKSSHR
jgi:hypothetical protein